jgi:protease secretion system outer membrane protein
MMKALLLMKLNRLFVGIIALGVAVPVFAVTIQDAFDNAIKLDPALRSSRLNQEANNENIAIARSRLLPQISLQGSTNQLTQTTTQDVPGNSSISKSFTGPSANHQFVIRQGLLRPKEISAINFAELQSQYGEVKYQSDLSELWLRVAYAWIDLVGAGQLAEAYKKPLASLHSATKQESAKFAQGDGTKDALAEAVAQYQFAKATYLQAEQTFKARQQTFALLTQIEIKSLEGKKLNLEPEAVFSEKDRDQLWKVAREKSFELRLVEIQQQLQRERVRMARADHLPTLDALATWNVAKNDATSTQGFQYKNNQIGIQYIVPIYAGGAISAAHRQAALALDASIADGEAVSTRLEGDFQMLWSAWMGQRARVQAGLKLVESAMEQLKATQLSQMHGVKSLSDVANAELVLSRRIGDQINFVMEYQKYSIRLSRNDLVLYK